MRPVLLFLLILVQLRFTPPAFAQESPPVCNGEDLIAELAIKDPAAYEAIVAEAAKAKNYEAKLWKIERSDLGASYLFGTANSTDPRVATLSMQVTTALSLVSTVALTAVDLTPEEMSSALTAQKNHFFLKGADRLSKYLSSEEYAVLQKSFRKGKSQIGDALLDKLQPWAASKMMPRADCVPSNSQPPLEPTEAQIEALAKRAGKKVVGLLSVDEMVRPLVTLPMTYQLDRLRADVAFVAERHEYQDHRETLTVLYAQNRMAEYRPFSATVMKDKELAHRVAFGLEAHELNPTSLQLRDRALPLLEKEPVFIAVTIGYLPGDKGLVALFREAGYTVTPVE